jgi:hypothetical protein
MEIITSSQANKKEWALEEMKNCRKNYRPTAKG